METRKKLDPAKTREEILAAATRCFAERGFAGASIGDVAKEADVPKSLVQYHFGSKEQLWDAATERRMGGMMEAIRAVAEGKESFENLIRTRFDFFASHPDAARLMSWAALQMPPLPRPVRESADHIRDVVHRQGPDLFIPLLMLCAMDGWHQNHRLYARVLGPQLLDPEMGSQFREGLMKVYEGLNADQRFKAILEEAIGGQR